jgi:DNA-binding transcriptional LysR family regulator
MDKLGNMDLFVRVIKQGGLAAAGREIGVSPARVTARINALEEHYNTRLLHRTTRHISLTGAGQRFYDACLRVLAEVETAETMIENNQQTLFGHLRITAPSDFGRQYVAPALADFSQQHPNITPYLNLTDTIINLVEYGYDLGIRYGNLPDSNLILKPLAKNHRVLVASPNYLTQYGTPQHPDDLQHHQCLILERLGEPFHEWQLHFDGKNKAIKATPTLSTNDGAVLRQWVLAGKGIAYKSIWDVKADLKKKQLQTVLDHFILGSQNKEDEFDLQYIYPSRQFIPKPVTEFINFFKNYLEKA